MNNIDSRKTLYDIMYNEDFKTRIIELLKARIPLVNLDTTDEHRAKFFLEAFSRINGYNYYTWDCIKGFSGTIYDNVTTGDTDIHNALKFIIKQNYNYYNNT